MFSLQGIYQIGVRIDSSSAVPELLRIKPVYFKMQVRRGRVGVAGAAYESDGVAAVYDPPLGKPVGVTIQMRVVIAIALRKVELIDGLSAWLAQKQLHDLSVIHREDGCTTRGHNIRRFVPSRSPPHLLEGIVNIRHLQSSHRQRNIESGIIGAKGNRSIEKQS